MTMLGPRKSKKMGNAVGGNAEHPAGHEITVPGCRIAEAGVGVVAARSPYEYGAVRAGQSVGWLSGVFHRFPGHFQQQSLLWVHLGGFPRRNVEKTGVETVDVFDLAGREGVGLTGRLGVRVEKSIHGPTVAAHLSDGIRFVNAQLPKRVG